MLIKKKINSLFFWEKLKYKTFYRLDDNEWIEYTAPFTVSFSTKSDYDYLSYYLVSEKGVKSDVKKISLDLPLYSKSDLAIGIKNNEFYKDDLELKKADTGKNSKI